MVSALKAGERDRASALRVVLAELRREAKEGKGDELAVLRRERKRRLDAAAQYQQAGRKDLAEKERAEAEMIEGYLPPEIGEQQLSTIVAEAIAETGASGPRDMGAVMKVVMARSQGALDGSRASRAVRAALGA